MIFVAWLVCMPFIVRIVVDSLEKQEQDSKELDC